jgi:ATP-dependent RNA helicase DeaD
MRRERIPSLDQVEEARDNVFFEKLRATLDGGEFRRHDRMIDRLIEQGYPTTDISSALIHMLRGPEPTAPARPAKPGNPFHSAPSAPPVAAAQLPPPRPTPPPEEPKSEVEPPARQGHAHESRSKNRYSGARQPRTGQEKGFVPVSFNVGHAQLVTPADIVGKIAGVTRLPAQAVGAIDIFENETHVDVAEEAVELVIAKLNGIRMREVRLKPSRITGKGVGPA